MICGWASIDERGKARGGRAGDQTGKELKTGPWYYFGQTVVIRWADEKKASLYSNIIKALCQNRHIGYDQNQRTSLYTYLDKRGWSSSGVLDNVECDCSELVVCAANLVFGSRKLSSALYTGNLASGLMATGYFKKLTGTKYMKSPDYLKKGDIIIKPNGHVISTLENGPKAGVSSPKTGKGSVAKPVLRKGSTGSEVKKLQANLTSCNIKDDAGKYLVQDGSFGVKTRSCVKNFQRKVFPKSPKEWDGVYGPKTYAQMKKKLS